MKKLFLSFALTLAFGAISSYAAGAGSMTDSRDGQTYKTVKIGSQVWMAENLNYKVNDGEQSWCYDNKKSNCKKYGRLYTWAAAVEACPSGWHLPSDEEWETLLSAVGDEYVAGEKLKSTRGWRDGGNGTDAFGFSVLSAGHYLGGGSFDLEGYGADFWSATEVDSDDAYRWYFRYDYVDVNSDEYDKTNGFSVRCLKD